ncbi:unnamed protein product [Oppiella nova]|uniref:UBC core domain-containing protein n=1 Tax=Oppiella nova TaxID=334625 RepID=A0A7R9LB70_9ACAR|nr:unnamed protein product [Oppiella nova]CAG2161652.1 unnamed protein product [Oppiella nova]
MMKSFSLPWNPSTFEISKFPGSFPNILELVDLPGNKDQRRPCRKACCAAPKVLRPCGDRCHVGFQRIPHGSYLPPASPRPPPAFPDAPQAAPQRVSGVHYRRVREAGQHIRAAGVASPICTGPVFKEGQGLSRHKACLDPRCLFLHLSPQTRNFIYRCSAPPQWDLFISGPPDSVYENHVLHAKMHFPSKYPFQPPTFRFVTKMFHPNIYNDGIVCISILHSERDDPTNYENENCTWTPGQNVRTVCLSIISLLNSPNIFSPANVDASKMLRDDKPLYEKFIKELLEKKKSEE